MSSGSIVPSPFETIVTNSLEVVCDGGNGPLGHPKVFLHIDRDTNQITCPYCSRLYIFHGAGHSSAA